MGRGQSRISESNNLLSINRNEIIRPQSLDPGNNTSEFLSWLKKRGGIWNLDSCKGKCQNNDLDPEKIIGELGVGYVTIRRSRSGEKVIFLEDWVWADDWMIFYGFEVPHHRHSIELRS